ncbi:MAG: hypothetical protein IJV15_15755 [Lachnospiraceae bacterium]|nr:hypothetical protein [Lachnospiraceae bacterium]
MNKKTIIDYACLNRIFTTEQIVKDLNIDNKSYFNTVMARLCNDNYIHRYEKGIYGICFKGKYIKQMFYPSEDEVINYLYLRDSEGFEAGAELIRKIGLSSWMSNKRYVITNKVKEKTIKCNCVLLPSPIIIDKENINTLRILNVLDNMDILAVDTTEPYKIICNFIKEKRVDYNKLFELGEKYYSKSVVLKIYEAAKWEVCHAT